MRRLPRKSRPSPDPGRLDETRTDILKLKLLDRKGRPGSRPPPDARNE